MRRTKGALTAVVLLLAILTPNVWPATPVPSSQDAPAVRVLSPSPSLPPETVQQALALGERVDSLLQATKAGTSEHVREILAGFSYPSDLAWLDNLFYPTPCVDSHEEYREGLSEFLETLPDNLRDVVARYDGDLQEIAVTVSPIEPSIVSPRRESSVLVMLQKPIPLFRVHLSTATDRFTHAGHPILWLGVFAYADGEFRYLPHQVLAVLPSTTTRTSVLVGGQELTSMTILNWTDPVYPRAAAGQCAGASVHLEGMVKTDGTVDLVYHPETESVFVQAAVEAIEQWRFEPFRLNRKKVPARITIDVSFHPKGGE